MQREGQKKKKKKDRMTHVAHLSHASPTSVQVDGERDTYHTPVNPVADLLQFRDSIYVSAQREVLLCESVVYLIGI